MNPLCPSPFWRRVRFLSKSDANDATVSKSDKGRSVFKCTPTATIHSLPSLANPDLLSSTELVPATVDLMHVQDLTLMRSVVAEIKNYEEHARCKVYLIANREAVFACSCHTHVQSIKCHSDKLNAGSGWLHLKTKVSRSWLRVSVAEGRKETILKRERSLKGKEVNRMWLRCTSTSRLSLLLPHSGTPSPTAG